MLQYFAVCCSALQCVADVTHQLWPLIIGESRMHTHCCSVLQCVAVCCSVLQCVAVHCSALQCVAVCCSVLPGIGIEGTACGCLVSYKHLQVLQVESHVGTCMVRGRRVGKGGRGG